MSEFFKIITARLNSLVWDQPHCAHAQVETLLEEINADRAALREELASFSFERRLRLTRYSHEPSTHFKWFLFKEPTIGYEVWIHEYKSKELIRPGYASVPHNHRYWFSSLILSGGFRQLIYTISGGGERFDEVLDVREQCLPKNTIYTVDSSTIHSLSDIEEGTVTLLIRCKAVKPFSEEFDLNSRMIRRHYPFSVRMKNGYPFITKI